MALHLQVSNEQLANVLVGNDAAPLVGTEKLYPYIAARVDEDRTPPQRKIVAVISLEYPIAVVGIYLNGDALLVG
jgi:hypothetical protein